MRTALLEKHSRVVHERRSQFGTFDLTRWYGLLDVCALTGPNAVNAFFRLNRDRDRSMPAARKVQ